MNSCRKAKKNATRVYLSRENFFATVELAGSPENIVLNEGNLLIESTETALGFPVKIHLTDNPGSHFLGEDCYIGSNEKPIMVDFVTGQSGSLHGVERRNQLERRRHDPQHQDNILVNNVYSAPEATGCGVEGGADEALNAGLGLPSETPGSNISVLSGQLYQSGVEPVRETLPRLGIADHLS